MAFTTTPGSSAQDRTNIIGTPLSDSVVINNDSKAAGRLLISGKNENDIIALNNLALKDGVKILGDAGNDTVTSTGTTLSRSKINGNLGDDILGTADNALTLGINGKVYGGGGKDVITLDAAGSGSKVNGQKGKDTVNLVGIANNAKISGGGNSDTINITGALIETAVGGDKGNDQLNINATTFTNSTVKGGTGNDLIDASKSLAAVNLLGEEDNDTINGGTGSDTLDGGTGDDTLKGNSGQDTLYGRIGSDTFEYSSSANLFAGNALIDNIIGDTGVNGISISNNNVNGNGNTTFTIGNDDAWTNNNSGLSFIKAAGASNQIISVDLDATAAVAGIATVDLSADTDATATNVIDVGEYTALGTTLTGSTGNEVITGGAGADTINARGGSNSINTGAGLDTINVTLVSTNRASLSGGGAANLTTLVVGGANVARSTTVQATADSATADQRATAATSTVGVIMTGAGADGAGGATFNFIGGLGADQLTGEAAIDTLAGGAGTDTLTGAAGNDSLTGGDDADTFEFADTAANNGIDTIADFVVAQTDVLDTTNFMTSDGGVEALAKDADQVLSGATDDDIFVVNQAVAINGKDYAGDDFAELFGVGKAFVTTDPAAAIANVIYVQGTDETQAYYLSATAGDAIAAADVTQVGILTGLKNTTAIVDANVV